MPQPTEEQQLRVIQYLLNILRAKRDEPETSQASLMVLSKKTKLSGRALCEAIDIRHVSPTPPEHSRQQHGLLANVDESFEKKIERYIHALFIHINKSDDEADSPEDRQRKEDYRRDKLNNSKNLYQLLCELNNDSLRIKNAQKLIKSISSPTPWVLITTLMTLLSAGLTGTGYIYKADVEAFALTFYNQFPVIGDWFIHVFALLKTYSLLMLAKNVIVLGFNLWRIATNDTLTTEEKRSALGFTALSGLLDISACALWYLNVGVMPIPAIALFILSTAVRIVESVMTRDQHLEELDALPDRPNWAERAQHIEKQNLRDRNEETYRTKLILAVIATAAITTLYASPATIVLSAGYFAFSWCLTFSGWARLSVIEKSHDDALNEAIANITEPTDPRMFGQAPEDMIQMQQIVSHEQFLAHQHDDGNSHERFLAQLQQPIPAAAQQQDAPAATRRRPPPRRRSHSDLAALQKVSSQSFLNVSGLGMRLSPDSDATTILGAAAGGSSPSSMGSSGAAS